MYPDPLNLGLRASLLQETCLSAECTLILWRDYGRAFREHIIDCRRIVMAVLRDVLRFELPHEGDSGCDVNSASGSRLAGLHDPNSVEPAHDLHVESFEPWIGDAFSQDAH
ncbi:hypothetical protein KM043_002250 [Ampulex compressa]|nr:hypothetical protein KM043_002250 [Ampulex compressa]